MFDEVKWWCCVLLIFINLPGNLKADDREETAQVSCRDEKGDSVDW